MALCRIAMFFACVAFFCTPLLAAEPIPLPNEVLRVVALRYPRNVEHLRLIQQQVQRVAEQAKPATVGILIGRGAGSGVIVSPDGLILTAAHVIGGPGRRATVLLTDGRRLQGRTLGSNHAIDAGMVQLDSPPTDLPFLPIAKTQPKIGEWVVATGQPGGVVDDRAPPVRLGRVLAGDDDWVCSDCTLVAGDSGGPLINLRGEVLAVHSSIAPAIVHNFHVPVVEIKKNWKPLLASKVLGKEDKEFVSKEMRPLMGIAGRTEGGECLITQVFPGLPAADVDLRPGDIVRRVDGERVLEFDEISKKVLKKRPGQSMLLEIRRDNQTLNFNVTLAGVRVPLPEGNGDRSESR